MFQVKQMESMIGKILTIGMLISVCLVLIGGSFYLVQFGHESLASEQQQTFNYATNITLILRRAFSFSSLGLIELGILVLVVTQFVRVGLLVWFYSTTRDFIFAAISLFILLILIYSLVFGK